ncbi:MAG: hypothetical protein WCG76_03275 [Verrucomicrobiota bacterium]
MTTQSVTSKSTRKTTSPNSSRIEACDRVIIEMGGRPATSEESRLFREAVARLDSKIARQLAVA